MSPEEALSLKLLYSKFNEATVALVVARAENIEKALKERDEARDELFRAIDNLTRKD